jgi:iron complex outermembrane receptor protein
MYSKKNKNGLIKEAVRLALYASLATATVAPVAFAQQDDEDVEEVIVTGSRITRSTIQESGNLVTMDRQQIDASGDLMIADVLRSSPLNTYGSFSERSGSSAQSNATIDLRGLGDSRTLVLINGHRIPGSPNLGAASVNINMIPMAAVERIDMLPDAASAVYGSDAIAGVVNIIMKKNYDGLQISVRDGQRSQDDGGDKSFSLLGGVKGDRSNITFGVEKNVRDAIFDADRPYTAARIDQTGGDDGVVDLYVDTDGVSFYGKTVWLYDPTTGYDQTLAATDCPTTGGFQGAIDFTKAWAAAQPSTACAFAYANVSANKAKLDRVNTFIDYNFDINDNTEFFANVLFSRVESFGRYAPPAAKWGKTGDFPSDYATNPFDIDALIANGDITADNYLLTGYYRWTNVGNRDNFVTDIQYDLTAGVKGDINDDVSYEVYGQYNRYDSKEQGRYYLSQLGLAKVLEDGLDPFSDEGAGTMRATVGQDNYTIMSKVYGHIKWSAGDLFDAGDVIMVAGAEQFTMDYQNLYDAASEAGLIGGSAGNSSAGDRDVTALFFEAVIPVADGVILDAALRSDDYSDFGSQISPSLGIDWAMNEDLAFRARVSKGFKAPALSDLYGPDTFSAEDATDYKSCDDNGIAVEDCPERQYDTYFSSNEDLGAEESTNLSLGVRWDFAEGWTADVAYWSISIDDLIQTRSAQSLLYAEAAGINVSDPSAGNFVDRTATGSVTEIHATSDNDGELDASGIDIKINGEVDTEIGTFTPFLFLSQSLSYEQQVYFKGPTQDTAGFSGQPELRMNLGTGWSKGAHSVDFLMEYIGDHAADDHIEIVGGEAKLVASNEKLDTWTVFTASYTYDADKYGKFTIGSTNLTDEDPVLDSEGKFTNPELYDNTGRVVYTKYTIEF